MYEWRKLGTFSEAEGFQCRTIKSLLGSFHINIISLGTREIAIQFNTNFPVGTNSFFHKLLTAFKNNEIYEVSLMLDSEL